MGSRSAACAKLVHQRAKGGLGRADIEVGIGKARRQIAAKGRRGEAGGRDRFQHYVRPSLADQAQRDVERSLLGRAGGVEEAARAIEQIAGANGDFPARRAGLMLGLVEGLAVQRQLDQRVVKRPHLRSGHLQHEHVVAVEVRGEALRRGRR